MMQNGECTENIFGKNMNFKHSVDRYFGLAVQSSEFQQSEWHVDDPLIADIIVVPSALLSFYTNGGWKQNLCRGKDFKALLIGLFEGILLQPYFNETNDKFLIIYDHFSSSEFMRIKPISSVLQNSIMATFEGRKLRFGTRQWLDAPRCSITTPYISSPKCIGINATSHALEIVEDAWRLQEPLFLFHFRGNIDHRRAYRNRRQVCLTLSDWVPKMSRTSPSESICCSSKKLEGSFFKELCSDENKVACSCASSQRKYCEELLSSRFSLFCWGDSYTSGRLFDAMRLGRNIVRLGENTEYLDQLVMEIPWDQIIIQNSTTGLTIAQQIDWVMQIPQKELDRRKEIMFQFSSVVDFKAYGGIPAAKWIIKNAFEKCL
mmetsp:Transcript_13358/g.19982  ORF Transcript_13358/g.19982 Transcript_13358/m.19982 type:complete len:376 (+) Transcript_13358:176-1303(+)